MWLVSIMITSNKKQETASKKVVFYFKTWYTSFIRGEAQTADRKNNGQKVIIMTTPIGFDMLDKIQEEIDTFNRNIKTPLTETSAALSKEKDKVKEDAAEAQRVSDIWNEAVKKRAERKNSIYKEIKSSIAPCFIKRKTEMLHSCLVCLRKTEACALQKIQDVATAKIKEKLVKQQFDMINNELKDAEKNFSQLESEKKVCSEIHAMKKGIKKIFDKIDIIYTYIYPYKDQVADEDFTTFFKKVEADPKWIAFSGSNLQEEVAKFKQDLKKFYDAKKRMDGDLDQNFSAQVIKRCSVLRYHDQQAVSFLNKVVGKKMAYEKERDDYKKFISIAENSYKKAIENFDKILKSPELTCLERRCVKTYSCDDVRKGDCDALTIEESCYDSWSCVNTDKIIYQKSKFGKDKDPSNNTLYKKLNDSYAELNNNETSYNAQCQDHLDKWEASIPESIWNNMLRYEESLHIITTMTTMTTEATSSEQCSVIDEKKMSIIEKKERAIVDAVKEWTASMYDVHQKKEEHLRYFIQHAQLVIEEQITYAEKNKDERMKVCLRGEANTFIDQDLYWVIPEMIKTRSRSLGQDPYSVINTANSSPCPPNPDESHLLFNDLFTIPATERAMSNMSMSICNFTPPCIHKSYCFDKKSAPSSCDGIKCNEPCYPQPPCVPAAAQPTTNPAHNEQK